MRKIILIFAVAAFVLASAGNSSAQSADVKAKDRNGLTALMRAASAGDADSVKTQIAAGADTRAKDKNGETALMKAAVAGNADSVQALITAGADVKAKDRNGQTALDKATAANIVKLLQEARGSRDVKKKDSNASIAAAGSGRTNGDDSVVSQVEGEGALITPPALRAGEGLRTAPTGGLIAYSLKAAQARVLASGSGGEWRRNDPELFTLAGMTRPEGVVVDRASEDIILIGHAEEGDAPLTLDDLVVALRARMIEGKWPVVSIDPVPGKPWQEGNPQTVRFEGGIQNTQFGADLLDADHRLKRMALGVLPTGVTGLTSLFERWFERYSASGGGSGDAQPVRLWFEPVQDRVIVRDDVVQLGPMTVSVFTEFLSAGVSGNGLSAKPGHDEASDAFAKDISSRFDDIARAHPTLARVRGLNGIVAVVAGLERIDKTPSLDYWLRQYALRTVKTPSTVKLLRRAEFFGNGSPAASGLAAVGGVELRAIALDLQSGDVSALRRAVLIARPDPTAISWRLIIGEWVIPLSAGALPPAAVGPLIAQAEFLESQSRLDDAMEILNSVLCMAPEGQTSPGMVGQGKGKSNLSPDDCLSIIRSGQMAADFSAAFDARGIIYLGKHQYDRAVQDFDEAIRLDSNDAGIFNNRGNAYDNKGEQDRAIQDYDQAIRLNPNLAAVFFNRGGSYNKRGQYDRAILDYDQAIRLDPTLTTVYSERGNAYDNKGEHDRAIQDFDQAIRLDPNDAKLFNNRGDAFEGKGQHDRAIQDYDQAILLSPNRSVLYYNRGNAYYKKGQSDRAIQDYDEAIRLDPNNAKAFNNRGIAYKIKGQFDRAIQDYDQVIRLDPNDAGAFTIRGNAYADDGQQDRAIQDYDHAIRLNEKLATAFYGRGNAYNAKGERDRAIQDYDQAIRLDPNDAKAFNNRGTAYNAKGQHDRAIQDYDQAIRLDQSVAEIFYNRGKAYRELGKEASASADFAKARQLNPDLSSPDPAPALYPPAMTASEEARLSAMEAKTVKNEREIYIWRASTGSGNDASRPRWSIRGVVGAADLLSGNPAGDQQMQLVGKDRASGFEIWQIAPENDSDVLALESGSVFVSAGDKESPMRAPIRFKRLQIPGGRTSWLFPLSDPDAKSGNIFLIFRPMIYPTSGGILALGGTVGFNNEDGMRTVTMRTIPASVTGTIRFPKDRWASVGAGFIIKGGGLQFDETGVFLMPGTQYVATARPEAIAVATNPAVAPATHPQSLPVNSSGSATEGKIAIMTAAYAGDLVRIKALIAANADVVNAKADDGRTALQLASLQGHLEVVQALIAAKADVNARTGTGISALIAAATQDHLKIVQALIAAKADVNAKTDDGITALYLADGDLEMVQALIAAKADVNAKTASGQTALMQAALENHLEVVQALIAANADVNIGNAKGLTALMLAERMGYEGVVQSLKKAGAFGN